MAIVQNQRAAPCLTYDEYMREADYSSIGVQECWVVRPVSMTVDVLVLKAGRLTPDTTYSPGQDIQSVVFTDLRVAVNDVFAQ